MFYNFYDILILNIFKLFKTIKLKEEEDNIFAAMQRVVRDYVSFEPNSMKIDLIKIIII